MACSWLPPFPRFVFTIFEPISLVAGCVPGIVAPDWFIGQQMAQHTPVPSSKNSQLVAQQLGNAFGLLAMVGAAVLYTTSEPKVVRNYLVALWIADIGHVYLTCRGLGSDRFMDVASWNAMTWGNVFVTLLLCLTRTAYLLGWFGPDRPVVGGSYSAAKPKAMKSL
ncbi:hypothetical protein MAPG_02336 [Magnaporthiopsis poae ATCC 64411]|uniref:DUF7704 domain-containing protein n=1 Tax=Magnaporthiopsis poae (strain ATCC 64411 / 73-15) TaxID=644358 RepID=A0A0C4DR35_MAGP6|nr:hypothetical protein MAPG_02336 [Magnaporthiopsis poae ATCC 64411]